MNLADLQPFLLADKWKRKEEKRRERPTERTNEMKERESENEICWIGSLQNQDRTKNVLSKIFKQKKSDALGIHMDMHSVRLQTISVSLLAAFKIIEEKLCQYFTQCEW